MRCKIGIVALLVGVGLAVSVANATVFYDPTNVSGSMTANGWSLAADSATDVSIGKSLDMSHSDPAEGTNGVWHVEDINPLAPATNSYMKSWKNDPGSLDGSRGMIMARINLFNSSTNSGTFGYSSASTNRAVLMSIRDDGVNFKAGQGSGSGSTMAIPGGTRNGYRAYAISYYNTGGVWTFDAWVSNGSDWSSNPADWTQLVANSAGYTIPQETLLNQGSPVTGVLLGSFGSSGNVNNFAADWLFATYTDKSSDGLLTPWADGTPEPATLALLAFGVMPLLRRRAR